MRFVLKKHVLTQLQIGVLSLAWVFVLHGCFDNEGIPTPDGVLNFPGAIRFSPDVQSLYVVNTNFDLRYSHGSLQSYDVESINQCISENCEGICEDSSSPYCCMLVLPESNRDEGVRCDMLKGEVEIPSYGEGLELSEEGTRLYLPVRSDASLTVVKSENGIPYCGTSLEDSGSCKKQVSERTLEVGDQERLGFPKEPTGIFTSLANQFGMNLNGVREGSNILLASHRNGSVSLLLEGETDSGEPVPVLLDVLSDLPRDLMGVYYDAKGLFWVPNSFSREITRVGVFLDELQSPYFAELFQSSPIKLRGLNTGATGQTDIRVIQFDPRADRNKVYLLSRQPEALLIGEHSEEDTLQVLQTIDLGAGPARMIVREINARLYAFVSCYDSRDIYIVDLDFGKLVGIIGGIGGPFEMAYDEMLNRLYVSDFRSFVIRIFSLDFLFECTPGVDENCQPAVVGLIGVPKPLEEL